MRPTFSRFDIHDLLDTLPPFVRHPMAVATMASVLAHGVIAVGLPVFAGSEEKKPERVVDVISLSPAEQGKLPSNSLMMPGGGLNGTSALPLPLTKNGTLSPLSGLSGSTLGSASSSYSGVPGLLDPPIISYTQTSPPRNSDPIFKTTSKTTKPLTGFTGNTIAFDIGKLTQPTPTEDKPKDPTEGKDKTDLPPGEKPPASTTIGALPTGTTGGTPAKTPEANQINPNPGGTLPDSGSAQNQQQPLPNAQLPTAAVALGNPNFGDTTKEVNMATLEGYGAFSGKTDEVYGKMLEQEAKRINPEWKADNITDTATTKNPLVLEVSAPLIPKTSDPITTQPVSAEFVLLITPKGEIYAERDPQGASVLKPSILRETGYPNLTNQAITYLQTQLPAIQKLVTEQVLPKSLPTPENVGKYRFLRVIIKPTATAATG
jgi:hypothetical protein